MSLIMTQEIVRKIWDQTYAAGQRISSELGTWFEDNLGPDVDMKGIVEQIEDAQAFKRQCRKGMVTEMEKKDWQNDHPTTVSLAQLCNAAAHQRVVTQLRGPERL